MPNPTPKIYKHTFTVTVLNEYPDYDPDSLDSLNYDITDGDSIGCWSKTDTEQLREQDVVEELCAIGNDGSFFDPLSEIEYD